ncbi:MAG TPA: hypothetical protein PKC87_06215 [Candidatus Absconditabacterales bacterium]|nr:hypothetical protein [Candidatus Absconditabacterales bacterium]
MKGFLQKLFGNGENNKGQISMKKCPFCAEEIQNEATKCRFCGEWIENNKHENKYSEDELIYPPQEISHDVNILTAGRDFSDDTISGEEIRTIWYYAREMSYFDNTKIGEGWAGIGSLCSKWFDNHLGKKESESIQKSLNDSAMSLYITSTLAFCDKKYGEKFLEGKDISKVIDQLCYEYKESYISNNKLLIQDINNLLNDQISLIANYYNAYVEDKTKEELEDKIFSSDISNKEHIKYAEKLIEFIDIFKTEKVYEIDKINIELSRLLHYLFLYINGADNHSQNIKKITKWYETTKKIFLCRLVQYNFLVLHLKGDKELPELVIKENGDITKTTTGSGVFPYVWIKIEEYKQLDEELSKTKEELDKDLFS